MFVSNLNRYLKLLCIFCLVWFCGNAFALPPVGVADSYTTNFETQLVVDTTFGVLSNDTDPDVGDVLSAVLDTDVSNGTLTLESDGAFTYTPNTGFSGIDGFDYVASDATEDSAVVTVTLTVGDAPNTPPTALADGYSTDFETQLVVDVASGVLSNDTDADAGDVLSAVLNTDVSNGTLTLESDGAFTYTPDSGFSGTDSFVYAANDATEDSAVVTVTLTVTSANNGVIDVWFGANQQFGNVGQPQMWANIPGNVSDPDGVASLSYTINGGSAITLSAGPDGGRLQASGDFNIDLERALLNSGSNLVEITLIDTLGDQTTTTVNVAYDAGTVWPDTYQVDWSQTADIQDAIEVVDGNWEITPDGLRTLDPGFARLFAVGDVSWGEYELNSQFTLHSYEASQFAGVGVITPWVGHTDDPIAGAQPKAGFLPYGAQTWAAYFPNTSPSRIQSAGNRTARETERQDYSLEQIYNFKYRVENLASGAVQHSLKVWSDGTSEPAAWGVQYDDVQSGLTQRSILFVAHYADVTFGDINVAPIVNVPPVSVADVYATDFETDLEVDVSSGVLSNDTDADVGDVLSAVLVSDASNGTLVLNSDGSFTYTPDADFSGTDSFDYVANDTTEDSAAVTVTLTVGAAPNAAPIALSDEYATDFETQLVVDIASGVLSNDTDADVGAELSAVLVSDVSNGTLVLNSDGSFTYTPDAGFSGTDSFDYVASDTTEDSAVVTATFTVGANPNADADLLALLSLDDDQTPTIATDSSGFGNNGVISGAAYVPNSGDGSSASLEFDGNDVVNLGALDVNGNGVTLAAWVNADSFPGANNDPRIISKAGGIAANRHVFMLSTTRKGSTGDVVLRGRVRINGSTVTFRANAGAMEPGVWYHTAMVYDESTLKLYLNGEEIASGNITGPVDQDSSIDVGIGGQPNGGFHWDGFIDDVRIAQRPFSAAEIQALFAGGRPITTDDSYSLAADEQFVTTTLDGVLANDTDSEGGSDQLTANLNTGVSNGALSFNSDGSFVYTPESGFSGTDTFTYLATDGSEVSRVTRVDLVVAPAGDSIIDVWYGSNQSFGNIGRPQVWANVLGNVSDPDGVTSLSYTVNGGVPRALSLGPDTRRLLKPGDFNIDLTRDDLLEGDNLVEITAVDTLNSVTTTTVNVNYTGQLVWPETYQVDWSEVGSIQDATEILDGLWEITPDGIRTVEPGYDRLFAIGEVSWDEYELVSSFTLHDYDAENFGGVGVIGPWVGHTDDPIAGAQPKTGFLPFGSQTWTAFFPGELPSRIQSAGHQISRELQNFVYELEQQYHFRYRVERVSQNFLLYSTKVWADGTAEPADWDVQYTDTTSGLTDGSVVFVAHFADVTFGDISVEPVISPPPSAVTDTYTVFYETPLSVDAASGVLGNDSGGSDVLVAMLATDVSNGTLTLNADGSFDYVPAAGFFGLDSFGYYATDGENDSTPVQVNLSITDPNADVDLLAHLSLDDDQTPTIATDSSLYGNNGEIFGATYVAETFDGSTSSLESDGDDVVNLGGLDVNGTGVTLAAWVRADTFSDDDPRIISKASGVAANSHVFMLSTTRRLSLIHI